MSLEEPIADFVGNAQGGADEFSFGRIGEAPVAVEALLDLVDKGIEPILNDGQDLCWFVRMKTRPLNAIRPLVR